MIFNSLDIMKPNPFTDEVDSVEGMDKRRKDGGERKERKPPPLSMLGDGSSIEVAKRPRGRPPGSKNKPKPPVVITTEAEPSAAMRPHVLEIAGGNDIVDCLARFSRRRKLGICVLAVSGTVVNVTIRQPGAETAIVFHGRFQILSISATFMPPVLGDILPEAVSGAGVTLSMAGPQGQIIGGTVVGPLLAGGVVMVVAAAFANPTFHKLPVEEDISNSVSGNEAATDDAAQPQQQFHEDEQQRHFHHFHIQQPHSSPSPPQPAASAVAEAGGITIYGSHFSPEIMWPPGGRPAHLPY